MKYLLMIYDNEKRWERGYVAGCGAGSTGAKSIDQLMR